MANNGHYYCQGVNTEEYVDTYYEEDMPGLGKHGE